MACFMVEGFSTLGRHVQHCCQRYSTSLHMISCCPAAIERVCNSIYRSTQEEYDRVLFILELTMLQRGIVEGC